EQRAVRRAVASSGHPAYQVVARRGRECDHVDELRRRLDASVARWKLEQSVVRLKLLRLAALLRRGLARETPDVLALEEDLRVLCVIEPVGFGLSFQERFRVTHVRAKVCGHLRGVAEERGE